MALFSQRKGIRPLQKAIQRESLDDDLRNRLWSALKLRLWDKWTSPFQYGHQDPESQQVEFLLKMAWLHYFKLPLDSQPAYHAGHPKSGYEAIRDYFFEAQWWEVYDFIEFVLKTIHAEWRSGLKDALNTFLEAENAAYRIVDDEVVEITDTHEIGAIESAIEAASSAASHHLSKALEMLSDRKKPDYRNSIKESISAVEAACQAVAHKPNATLSDCIKALKDAKPLHPAFEQALIKLYAYTSDDGGIRHALTDPDATPSYGDAKFMLVSCAAFVSYLWTKSAELGIKIKKA